VATSLFKENQPETTTVAVNSSSDLKSIYEQYRVSSYLRLSSGAEKIEAPKTASVIETFTVSAVANPLQQIADAFTATTTNTAAVITKKVEETIDKKFEQSASEEEGEGSEIFKTGEFRQQAATVINNATNTVIGANNDFKFGYSSHFNEFYQRYKPSVIDISSENTSEAPQQKSPMGTHIRKLQIK